MSFYKKKLLLSPSRRQALLSSAALVAAPALALAQPKEFESVGTQAPPPDGETAFETLPSGVKVKTFKTGVGEAASLGSTVSIQCIGRLLNLNGVNFYSTKYVVL